MSKRRIHHLWVKLRPLNPWYLLVIALIFGGISIYGMRQNNLTMLKLRDQVFAADKSGGDVEGALRNLREFIYSHMNTNLNTGTSVKPPIQLKYTYDRLVQAEKDRVGTANTQIYTDAQHHCEALYPGSFSGGPRVPCITDYVNTHGVKQQPIPDSLYKFDFVSPAWTPDLAGWSLVIAVIFSVLFAARFALELWLKHELHDHM